MYENNVNLIRVNRNFSHFPDTKVMWAGASV